MTQAPIQLENLDEEVKAFDRKRYSIFEALLHELVNASANAESSEFSRIFRHTQDALGRTDLQMSLLFKVSRPTIGRWSRGVTMPHPMLRKAVFDSLLIQVKQALKSLRQPET